jgi:hypothetical protein
MVLKVSESYGIWPFQVISLAYLSREYILINIAAKIREMIIGKLRYQFLRRREVMRRQKDVPVIELTQVQRETLKKLSRKHLVTALYVKRAKAILALDEGKSISETGRLVQMERRHIYKWLDRYKEFGELGLNDLHRPGRPKANSIQE